MVANLKITNHFLAFLKLFKLEKKEENVTSVVYRILRNTGTKVTFSSLYEYLKTHPDYPSLKSICDFFDEMSIINYPIRINESELFNLNSPFIAYTSEPTGKVIVVYSVDKEFVVYANSLYGKKTISTTQFLEIWDGVVILVEPTELSGETDYNEKHANEIIGHAFLPGAIFIFCVAIIVGSITNKFFSIGASVLSLLFLSFTHLAGLTFSLLLLMHELDLKTKFTDKLCHITTNADCDAVTKSKASAIFGNINWADVGVTYFIGGLVTFFIIPGTYTLNNLALFAIFSIPYPVFSILYQWLKIRKWCPLCLSVQFVLSLESIIIYKFLNIRELNLASLIQVLVTFSIVFIIVLLLKYLFISEREKDNLKLETLKIKREPELFLFKLKKGERINIPESVHTLIFGDPESKVLISVFLSFYCSSCSRKFNEIQKIIANNNKVKVQIIFSPTEDDISIRFLKLIYVLMKSGTTDNALEELKKWYNTVKEEKLKIQQVKNIQGLPDGFEEMINYNYKLFNKGKVIMVPSVYVNGYPLPDIYLLEDIKYHIPILGRLKHELIEVDA